MWLCLVETWRQSGDQVPFMLTTYGTCEDGTGGPNNASGGGGGAPTGVSIATQATGNFNNAVIIGCDQDPLYTFLDLNSGSTFSSNAATIGYTVGPNYSSAVIGANGKLTYIVFGYIRATGATSFQWDLSNVSSTDSNSAWTAVGTNGTPSTAQNRTSNDVGEEIKVVHSSGGRGYLLPASFGNSSIEFDVDADATNSSGTTSANTLTVKLESN